MLFAMLMLAASPAEVADKALPPSPSAVPDQSQVVFATPKGSVHGSSMLNTQKSKTATMTWKNVVSFLRQQGFAKARGASQAARKKPNIDSRPSR